MKLKLLQAGYENMTGYLGMTMFENGLSVADVPLREARNLGMAIKVQYEDGTNPNPAQNLLESMNDEAGKVEAPLADSETKSPRGGALAYTQESLEAIADKDGIKGLRAVAEKFNVKGSSIAELIREILAAQVK